MNYRNIIMMALVALVTACSTPPTKSLENSKPLQEPIAESSEIKAKATTSSTSNQSNSISTENPSPDTKNSEVEKQNNSKLPIVCGKEEYRSFFEDFVRGKDFQGNEIRYTFTSPYVQVRDYRDPSKLLETMSRRNDEFSISLRDYRWVQLVPADAYTPYTRLKIDISRVDDKTFRVDYIKAQYQYSGNDKDQEEHLVKTYGDPNAYIFEHRNGCWNLTQKLQSSTRSQIGPKTEGQIAIEAILKKQMLYDDLRTALLKNGWLPVITRDCKSNVGGEGDICDKTPELDSCSGDGYCLMHFAHKTDNLKLSITTYGRAPYVTQWGFSNLKNSEGL
ncbi:hypothetical protein [Pseudanabaena sp. BC1403]|uniref:hypothetical protein n=1 Tax=Pseudanabaena sp. BC1403 TaxID=2043171 RepID=UPI0011AF462C|nr:hypothetical protein [Pseudanabaena sp. BC1403]